VGIAKNDLPKVLAPAWTGVDESHRPLQDVVYEVWGGVAWSRGLSGSSVRGMELVCLREIGIGCIKQR
jgi:hypothetical protein